MIEQIQKTYRAINTDTINQGILNDLYTPDVVFIDPFHHIDGMPALEEYFRKLYRNVNSIEWQFGESAVNGDQVFMEWDMLLSHPRLSGGNPVTVNGTTRFQIRDGKVCLHRDYLDTAQMLYENLPVLGGVIRTLRKRMGQ